MKLKPPVFEPKDFSMLTDGVCAKQVNTRLTEWWSEVMKDAQVVYGCSKSVWYDENGAGATQKALLIGIEQIKECEHEPDVVVHAATRVMGYASHCKKCGVKLKSKGWIAE